jgi:hypothetical protein
MCTSINDNVRGVIGQIGHTKKASTVNMFMLQ